MCRNSGSAQCHPVSYGCFSFVRCFAVLDLRTYVWYGYVAFTRRIGVGYHLYAFGNQKVLALEDGRETTFLLFIFGFLAAAMSSTAVGLVPIGDGGAGTRPLSLEMQYTTKQN